MIGTIHNKGTLFLRVHVGEVSSDSKHKYEMSLVNGSIPAIESKQTGKYFSLSWTDILNLAIEAGIDKEEVP